MELKKMSGAELKIMELIWQNAEGLDSSILYDKFHEFAYSTVSTRLGRMEKKGFIARKREGRHYVLIPLISKDEYDRRIQEQDFDKIYNKMKKVVSCFGGQKITQDQCDKLKEMLDEMRND